MALGFKWVSRHYHILDSVIVTDFQVHLVLAVISALDHSNVGLIVGSIVGSEIGSELCFFSCSR